MKHNKICILMGSPRKQGNTAMLLDIFCDVLDNAAVPWNRFDLYNCDIEPCHACRECQENYQEFACVIRDDMQNIAACIMDSELVIIATPIYSWYCTAPVKAAMDRLVYGMNKYYGKVKGPSIWKGKKIALVTTCGYPPEKGADLWEEGIKRYCKHSGLEYVGMLVERHMGYNSTFMDQKKKGNIVEFANKCLHDVQEGIY